MCRVDLNVSGSGRVIGVKVRNEGLLLFSVGHHAGRHLVHVLRLVEAAGCVPLQAPLRHGQVMVDHLELVLNDIDLFATD